MCKEYNGYSNYPTWAVELWIDNDEGSYNYWHERAEDEFKSAVDKRAATYALAKVLEEEHDELNPAGESGVFADLMTFALGMVDWYEIAGNLLEEYTDEDEETDDDDPPGANPCPVCNGVGMELGALGKLRWYRCQDCGMEFNVEDPADA